MPSVGLGTFLMQPDKAEQAVYDALKLGYRMVDTANAISTSAPWPRHQKSGVPRDEIFIATKLWPSVYGAGRRGGQVPGTAGYRLY